MTRWVKLGLIKWGHLLCVTSSNFISVQSRLFWDSFPPSLVDISCHCNTCLCLFKAKLCFGLIFWNCNTYFVFSTVFITNNRNQEILNLSMYWICLDVCKLVRNLTLLVSYKNQTSRNQRVLPVQGMRPCVGIEPGSICWSNPVQVVLSALIRGQASTRLCWYSAYPEITGKSTPRLSDRTTPTLHQRCGRVTRLSGGSEANHVFLTDR